MFSKPPLPPQPPRVAALGTSTRASASASTAATVSRRRAATDLGNPAAIEMAKARAMYTAGQERPIGLLETDLDEAVYDATSTRAAAGGPPTIAASAAAAAATAAATTAAGGKKTRSLLDLNHTSAAAPRPRPEHALHVPQSPVGASHRTPLRDDDDVASVATSAIHQRPHKSMEFLLDKENLHFVKVRTLLRLLCTLARDLSRDVLAIYHSVHRVRDRCNDRRKCHAQNLENFRSIMRNHGSSTR